MTRILHSSDTIKQRVAEIGRRITADYAGRTLDVVCLINGGSAFCADLVRYIEIPTRQHYLGFTSYSPSPESGEVRFTLDVAEPLQGKDVLVVEGIVVSGRTPLFLMQSLGLRRPASLALCALATKPRMLAVELEVKYSAFELGDEMACGYGVGKGPERASPHLLDARP